MARHLDPKVLALALVALLAGVGTVLALSPGSDGPRLGAGTHPAGDGVCGLPGPSGDRLDADRQDSNVRSSGRQAERAVTFTLRTGLHAGTLGVCGSVGDVEITHGSSRIAEVTFHITARGSDARAAAETAEVVAEFRERDGRLNLVAAHLPDKHRDDELSVAIHIELPDRGDWDVVASTGVGDIELGIDRARGLALHTGVGDIDTDRVALLADSAFHTGVGDLDLDLAPSQSLTLTLETGTGDIDLLLPGTSSTGYDVRAETGVGSVDVDIGSTEERSESDEGPSHQVHARSKGYQGKAVKVPVRASAGVGSIDVST